MPLPNFKLYHGLAPDSCEHPAEELAAHCVSLIKEIEGNFQRAYCLSECRSGSTRSREALLNHFGFPTHEEHDKVIARGVYILFADKVATRDTAFYVGVANDVPKRLTNHLACSSAATSSLLYLLLKKHLSDDALTILSEKGTPRPKRRKELFAENKAKCEEIRDYLIDKCSVVIHPVPDILTLHLLEPLLSVELKTGPWNSFRPH